MSNYESDLTEEFDDVVPQSDVDAANAAISDSLPDKSRDKYEKRYEEILTWQKDKKSCSFAEEMFLAYFAELSGKMKSSTLWSIYSMLRRIVNINHNIDIKSYGNLQIFLKKKHMGYAPHKADTFEREQVYAFIDNAPDNKHLCDKVVLILGLAGACRRKELYDMELSHVQVNDKKLTIQIPDTKTHKPRWFFVEGYTAEIVLKYMELRPAEVKFPNFFLIYRKGTCINQPMGINNIGNVPSAIATFLKLPDPKKYTSHTLRRTSSTLLVDEGADTLSLRRHGGWKSNSVAEGYVENSMYNKKQSMKRIFKRNENLPDEVDDNQETPTSAKVLKLGGESNSTNITIYNNNNSLNLKIEGCVIN